MAYSPPSLKVYQEFVPQLAGNTLPLYACIIAPQYGLHRFTDESEKALLGAYNSTIGNTYTSWPDKTAGSTVDVSSSEIWVEDGILEYYSFTLTGAVGDGLTVNGGNKIRSNALVFRTLNGTARSSVYGTRDVALGDYVKVQYGSTTLETTVSGVEVEEAAAVVGTLGASSTNQAAIVAASATVTENIASTAFAVTGSAAAYDGIAEGDATETYTVVVIATDGTVDNTSLSVTSASGNDDVATKALSASGVATACGTRGATFTLTADGGLASTSSSNSSSSVSESSSSSVANSLTSSSSSLFSSSSETLSSTSDSSVTNSSSSSSESSNIDRQLVVGDYWTVAVAQAYVLPIPTSGGTYVGTRDTTYLGTITQGGVIGTDTVKVQPSTTNGYDGGSEVSVTVAGAISLGNYGVTMTLNTAEQYVAGDVFTIASTAAADGAVKTLILADKLTGALTTDTILVTQGLTATFELDDVNWTASSSQLVVAASATQVGTYLGTSQSFDILSGDLYVDYRELLVANTTVASSLSSISDVEDALGPVHPDNPLSMMVYTALLGSNGTSVYYIATTSTTAAGYTDALDRLTEVSEAYSLVPHDTSRTIADLIEAHVDEMSAPDNALFRILWRGLDIKRLTSLYAALADTTEILATVTGTQLLATGAKFITNGVAAADIVRINYHQDGVGNIIYDSYIVDSVISEDEIKLLTGPTTPIAIAIKMEVWRNASLNQYAANISAEAIHHDNRRVTAVWAEPISLLGHSGLSNAYLAALLAGTRSAGAPHQPMTLTEVSYISMTVGTNFGATQLNSMAGNGVWLVVQDVDGTIYNRHQVTTDPFDVFTREQTITTNLDHVSRDYKTAVSDLYGQGNVSQSMLRLIEGRIDSTTTSIIGRIYSEIIGPQMESIKITRLEADAVLRDQVWVEMDIVLPVPLNHLVLKFRLI